MTENKEMVEVKEKENTSIEETIENERSFAPYVDIYETDEDFILIANMPGVERKNVQLKLEEGSLIIFGKIDLKNMINRKYILNESEIGHFYRKFKISDSIDAEKIDAQYENGQLVVKLPKHERIKPKTIDIN